MPREHRETHPGWTWGVVRGSFLEVAVTEPGLKVSGSCPGRKAFWPGRHRCGRVEARRWQGPLKEKEGQQETKASCVRGSALTHSHTSSWKIWIPILTAPVSSWVTLGKPPLRAPVSQVWSTQKGTVASTEGSCKSEGSSYASSTWPVRRHRHWVSPLSSGRVSPAQGDTQPCGRGPTKHKGGPGAPTKEKNESVRQ